MVPIDGVCELPVLHFVCKPDGFFYSADAVVFFWTHPDDTLFVSSKRKWPPWFWSDVLQHVAAKRPYRERLYNMAGSLLAKGRGKTAPAGKQKMTLDKDFVKRFPILSAYLTDQEDENGKERSGSKITIFVENGAVKGSLSDPDNEQSLYVAMDGPEAAFHALEARLDSGDADWRSWKPSGAKKKK